MLKIKGKLSIATAMLLVAALVSTGCGKPANEAKPSVASSQAQQSTKAELKSVKLSWYFPAAAQPDQNMVFEKVSSMINEKIKATVEFNVIDMGSFNDKMRVKTAAAEPYDITFTSGWSNPYTDNVSRGAFLELDELLKKNAPKLLASMPKYVWEGTKINGKIYSVPNYQIMAATPGMWFKKDLVDKYKIDLTKLKPGMPIKDFYAVLESYFKIIKEKEPEIYPIEVFQKGLWGNVLTLIGHASVQNWYAMINMDKADKIVNSLELPEFKEYLTVARDWYNKGYIRKDVINLKQQLNNPDEKAGKYFCGFEGTYKPGGDAEKKAAWGYDCIVIPVGIGTVGTGNITSTLNAVSRTSVDPDRAVMLLELINSDKVIYNTLCYGLEGNHYKKVSDTRIEPVKDSKYMFNSDWMFGNQFNAYLTPGKADTVWEDTKKLNDSAKASPLLGFSVNPEPIKAEIPQCNSVLDEFFPGMGAGAVDWQEPYAKMMEKLEKAGLKKIHDEVAKQIADWKKLSGK